MSGVAAVDFGALETVIWNNLCLTPIQLQVGDVKCEGGGGGRGGGRVGCHECG